MQMLRAGRAKEAAPPPPVLVVLGAAGAGKSALLAATRLVPAPPPSAPAPSFAYAELADGDDVLNRAGVWEARPGLDEVCATLPRPPAALLLVLDGSRPWELGAALAALLARLPAALPTPLPPPDALRLRFLSYREPGAPAVDASALELPAGVLEHNYGVPVVIAVTKSDAFSGVAKELDYKDAHWDFMQTHLRRAALRYGAALLFCSARKELNTALLGDYLRHLLWGTPFARAAQVAERDTLFVPLGWDSAAKIAIDFANQKLTADPDLPFEDAIRRPAALAAAAVAEGVVSADDDQAFLHTQLTIIGRPAADAPAAEPEPPRTPVKDAAPAPKAAPGTPLAQLASPLAAAATPGASPAGNDHAVLSNFFNSLINKSASPAVRKPDLSK